MSGHVICPKVPHPWGEVGQRMGQLRTVGSPPGMPQFHSAGMYVITYNVISLYIPDVKT